MNLKKKISKKRETIAKNRKNGQKKTVKHDKM